MDERGSLKGQYKGEGIQTQLDVERDSPELEAELLNAIDGPFAPY